VSAEQPLAREMEEEEVEDEDEDVDDDVVVTAKQVRS
jgi:hypothetical protein